MFFLVVTVLQVTIEVSSLLFQDCCVHKLSFFTVLEHTILLLPPKPLPLLQTSSRTESCSSDNIVKKTTTINSFTVLWYGLKNPWIYSAHTRQQTRPSLILIDLFYISPFPPGAKWTTTSGCLEPCSSCSRSPQTGGKEMRWRRLSR